VVLSHSNDRIEEGLSSLTRCWYWFEIFSVWIGRFPENGRWIYQSLSYILMPKYYPLERKPILLHIFMDRHNFNILEGKKNHCRYPASWKKPWIHIYSCVSSTCFDLTDCLLKLYTNAKQRAYVDYDDKVVS
jgi:hypothetical protein